VLAVALLVSACGAPAEDAPATPTPPAATPAPSPPPSPPADATVTPTPTPTVTATPTETPIATPADTPTATPTPEAAPLLDIRATWLRIPALSIDAPVQDSHVVPMTGTRPASCPAPAPGATTLSVPAEGIATPVEVLPGLDHRSWIYGHSRWLGEPGLFAAIQHLEVGDELFLDGFDRASGAEVSGKRFVVSRLYLTDTDSGGALVMTPGEPPRTEEVVLQTSVRQRGDDSPWILDRATVMAKAEPVVEGDLDDRCKYLLLFVVAEAG
jgi:hypothetical protein